MEHIESQSRKSHARLFDGHKKRNRRLCNLLISLLNIGAGDGTRTRDRLITNQLLYQLSYASVAAHYTQ
jgi:hypothetical protein